MEADFNRAGAVFCKYLVERISKSGSGAAEDGAYISPDRPRDRFFIGRLSPAGLASVTEEILENSEDFFSRLNPCSMRIRFLLQGGPDARISILPSFHLYVRVFPEYERQVKDAELVINRDGKAEIMAAFQRVEPSIEPIEFTVSDLIAEPVEVEVPWDRAAMELVPGVWRDTAPRFITASELATEKAYENFVGAISGKAVLPKVDISVLASAEPIKGEENSWEVVIGLVNRSQDSDPAGISRLCDEVIFNAGMTASLAEGYIKPYEFPILPKSYRFDRRMYGMGINCGVSADGDNPDRPVILRTQAVPTFEQKRFDHRTFAEIVPTFNDLAGSGAERILMKIADEMERFDETEWEAKGRELRRMLPETEQEVEEFDRDRAAFARECQRFGKGIECLNNPTAFEAFSLMNKTFELMGEEKRRDRWRLFQIVFIVSLLPSVVGREFPEYADPDEWDITDVVWFPTGGGKTEAYLGLTVFALFFDRLRGRDRGVTALYRFPLRLLSLQQFQRIVKTVAVANRIKDEAHISGRPFTVGHWIGSGGSPNQISPQEGKEYAREPALIQKYRKLAECPNPGCGIRDITMRFDTRTHSLQHVCPQCGVLPVLIVDHELYRYLPSIVVGTVDKMAVFGQQRRFSNLMGWTRGFCSVHGYAPEDRCEICGKKNLPEKPLKDPVPSLHVQDELHLLKEDLGAFDSHYETSVIEMQKAVPGSLRPWKTIAATATIEEYERHVEHLYLNRGRRFPTSGPSYSKTFFAETDPDRISRLFVGINPCGLTHINAMVAILWYFHREISQLREVTPDEFLDQTGLGILLPPSEVGVFMDQYEIGLSYVLTKKAGDQMAESIDAQVGNYLIENGYQEIISEVLSGGTTSEKITEVMDRIEKFDLDESDHWKRIRSVVATSMISHGVDVERFNFISFFGMPRMTSEYIQASSRVGRTYPGIVLTCFAPARERDRSHYHLFGKYHEYLERLVEAAAINRWSRFSIEKTIAGVVLGYIANELSKQTGSKLTTGRAIRQLIPEDLSEEKLQARISEYYGASRQDSKEFQDIIETKVGLFINGLPNTVRPILERRGWRPMRSLRDTDRQIAFRPAMKAAPLFELLLKDRISESELEPIPDTEG
ncbi:MAG: helicase-related protein [Candidatus Odinarchaeota archaeon]